MSYEILRFLHILGAMVLMGTGMGIAFFMLISHRRGDAGQIAHVAGIVVLADMLFTATAAVAQPITGYLLARHSGWPLTEGWLGLSLLLYLLVGAFWLPVVWMQMRMRDLALRASRQNAPLPPAYHRLFRLWFAFGVPAFTAMLGIIWLMLTRPAL
ncbi:DUF2269 domain-containing protein [Paracoccus sp. M683]|uniref:DUF2269 family protein n=1 Tax=Paracoccus sp. M683 TaxID=2594268 RepID=UPI001180630D|nr:DUF2269 domain-containing protein [Paracoccus sp. M683]TRW98440.1 DUF2269 domain-containing protein [Paracoccus sp. M683]